MEQELKTLENAEEIKSTLNSILQGLDESEHSASMSINEAKNLLLRLPVKEGFEKLQERLESLFIELRDIIDELGEKENHIEHDQQKIEEYQDKLGTLYRLMQKHQLDTTAALISARNEIELKVSQSSNIDEELERSRIASEEAHKDLLEKGEKLSVARSAIFKVLEKRIAELLAEVGITDASILIKAGRVEPTKSGLTMLTFCSALIKVLLRRKLNMWHRVVNFPASCFV